MLVLGIETSSVRGSVALVESGQVLAEASHDVPNAHGERILGLVDRVFEEAGCTRTQLARVAVGRGPGTFTGLRIGLALAQGIASALGIEAVGIGSLRAMAAGLPPETPGLRWPMLDARRGEVFLACFDADGLELLSPRAVPRVQLADVVSQLAAQVRAASSAHWLLGAALAELPELAHLTVAPLDGRPTTFRLHHGPATDWPCAAVVAKLGSNPQDRTPAAPDYLRDADAVLPDLPVSPLSRPRSHT